MMQCNLCGHAAHTRTSRYVTSTLIERYQQCQNVNCSHTFLTHESFVKSIVTPGKVDPVELHVNPGEQMQLLA